MATTANISDNILKQCTPAASLDASRFESMTLASIPRTTDADLDAIYTTNDTRGAGDYRIIGDLLTADLKGKACGAKTNGFADFLKANTRIGDGRKVSSEFVNGKKYRVRPYVLMDVEDPINNQYWSVKDGADYTTEGAEFTAGVRYTCKVKSQTMDIANARWFNSKSVVTITGRTATGGKNITSYKVYAATVSGDWVTLQLIPLWAVTNASTGAVDGDAPMSAFRPALYSAQIATGVLTRGLPNVTPAESYCDDIPGLNTTRSKAFWLQFSRRTNKMDAETEEMMKLIAEGNPLYKKFHYVDSVKLNRQRQEDYDYRLANSFLTNPALANQTIQEWDNLEGVPWANASTATLAFPHEGDYYMYRANALGYLDQLAECTDEFGNTRLWDMAGQAIDLLEFHDELYRMLRVRKANGLQATSIDVFVTSSFREQIIQAYLRYFKAKSEGLLSLNQELTTQRGKNDLGFTWKTVHLDWPAVDLNFISHDFFDDYCDAHRRASVDASGDEDAQDLLRASANLMLIPDWSTVYRSVFESRRDIRKTGTAEDFAKVDPGYLCGPLDVPQQSVEHVSELWTTILECPGAHLAMTNFSDALPVAPGVIPNP